MVHLNVISPFWGFAPVWNSMARNWYQVVLTGMPIIGQWRQMVNDVEMMINLLLQLKNTKSASYGLKSELFARLSMSAQRGIEPVQRLPTIYNRWSKAGYNPRPLRTDPFFQAFQPQCHLFRRFGVTSANRYRRVHISGIVSLSLLSRFRANKKTSTDNKIALFNWHHTARNSLL